jgi:hypothetical protein
MIEKIKKSCCEAKNTLKINVICSNTKYPKSETIYSKEKRYSYQQK